LAISRVGASTTACGPTSSSCTASSAITANTHVLPVPATAGPR
jgi:hypothetical protein